MRGSASSKPCPPGVRSVQDRRTRPMIVLGADTHKRSHTIAAVAAPTGELLGEQTVPVGPRDFGALLRCARRLDEDRAWALEDCRHVSGSLERFPRRARSTPPPEAPRFSPALAWRCLSGAR